MEKYRQDFGSYSYKEPLSYTAGRIMTALQCNPPAINNPTECIAQDKNFNKKNGEFFPEDHDVHVKKQESLEKAKIFSKNVTGLIVDRFQQQHLRPLRFVDSVKEESDSEIQEHSDCFSSLDISNVDGQGKELLYCISRELYMNFSGQKLEHSFAENGEGRKQLQKLSKEFDKSDQTRICNIHSLSKDNQCKLLEEIKQARVLIVTLLFQDGSSQLSANKDPTMLVKGIIILIKRQTVPLSINMVNDETCIKDDKYVYVDTGDYTIWKKGQVEKHFIRKLLLLIVQSNATVICFNAKDFLRTVLIYENNESWKKVLKNVVLDPRIAAWLLNPADCNPSFEDLVGKFCGKFDLKATNSTSDSSCEKICTNMNILYMLMMNIGSKLQLEGLWELFCNIELPLTTILAVMEMHKIQVNQEELKKTSELLRVHLKHLEREAHHAAGQKFKLSSSNELREVLFDKLHLHLQCTSKKLPRTSLRHLPSTAEPVLHQLQDLHPLPKIILEYRQIQKTKSTYVDGLLSCTTKSCEPYVSPTWNQTGTVSGRLSAKHPNIQGIPKLPVQILKQQYIQGKEKEIITVNPRSMFISAKGYTFLAADFSQVELRILAHFSSDPELLKLFQESVSTDVFTTLASQWKNIAPEQVTPADREQAKRVAYSVIYGAGKERLSECLGITPAEANTFIECFLQKYKVSDFTQRIIQQCHSKGFVVSLMGRKRPLPQITAQNFLLRTHAERQAVNFVIQGSAADLCKMAMIKISSVIAKSSTLTARLIAQIHDELLFEVEDQQIHKFAKLVKEIMESLQHDEGVQLKVPLKVSLSAGKSWGCMTELQE